MKPRLRVLANGWIRHSGDEMPPVLTGRERVNIVVRAGNASFIQGYRASAYNWRQRGFSGDIIELNRCGDHDARRSVEHWIRAWDKALGRGDTIQLNDRIRLARQAWSAYLYQDGAGI